MAPIAAPFAMGLLAGIAITSLGYIHREEIKDIFDEFCETVDDFLDSKISKMKDGRNKRKMRYDDCQSNQYPGNYKKIQYSRQSRDDNHDTISTTSTIVDYTDSEEKFSDKKTTSTTTDSAPVSEINSFNRFEELDHNPFEDEIIRKRLPRSEVDQWVSLQGSQYTDNDGTTIASKRVSRSNSFDSSTTGSAETPSESGSDAHYSI
ncbi:hypothetical protein CANARDRAFT_28781 [[Candida] arabinofermentans NRRL YB-2248]|uniref:Uncharacterized protein n=1 Tax=[Candida] arabinofermentans NRRL YB-2248 TaxID=983967 RepID=A0A1E4T027_9ASCO|nr:hypothetical protein CANARDRAFT_28781 [[Candida] arabinofermentans NRRL YB-2248]